MSCDDDDAAWKMRPRRASQTFAASFFGLFGRRSACRMSREAAVAREPRRSRRPKWRAPVHQAISIRDYSRRDDKRCEPPSSF